jgi:hypothetical protein
VWAQLCSRGPLTGKPVQVLVPGGDYTHVYWDWPNQPGTYSYVGWATQAGYATLNLDKLGYGLSDHPDPSALDFQTGAYVVHQVVQYLRNGSLGAAFSCGRWASTTISGAGRPTTATPRRRRASRRASGSRACSPSTSPLRRVTPLTSATGRRHSTRKHCSGSHSTACDTSWGARLGNRPGAPGHSRAPGPPRIRPRPLITGAKAVTAIRSENQGHQPERGRGSCL